MIDTLLLKLRVRDEVSAAEEAALRAAVAEQRDHPADRTFIREGQELDSSTLLVEGLVCRYKDLRDGSRQITALHVAGDFVDLHSFTLKRLDHNIMTLTPCRIALVPHARLKEITETLPHLTRMLWFSTTLDAAIQREWELSLGPANGARQDRASVLRIAGPAGPHRAGGGDRLRACRSPRPSLANASGSPRSTSTAPYANCASAG